MMVSRPRRSPRHCRWPLDPARPGGRLHVGQQSNVDDQTRTVGDVARQLDDLVALRNGRKGRIRRMRLPVSGSKPAW
jgi:hypothetical protein